MSIFDNIMPTSLSELLDDVIVFDLLDVDRENGTDTHNARVLTMPSATRSHDKFISIFLVVMVYKFTKSLQSKYAL